MKDYYTILGVRPSASAAEIKTAFRRLAIRYHPDRNPSPDAADKFHEINEAYDTLGDPLKRSRYDVLRENPLADLLSTPPPRPHRDPAYRRGRRAARPPTGPPRTFVLMKRYLPHMMWISRAGLLFLSIFIIDYYLPLQQRDDRISQIYVIVRKSNDALYDIVTDEGKRLRLDDDRAPSYFPDGRIRLLLTPVLGSIIYAGTPDGRYTEFIARMYTSQVFFPILLLLTSGLAFVYRAEVEFCFNLNLVGLALLIINLLLI